MTGTDPRSAESERLLVAARHGQTLRISGVRHEYQTEAAALSALGPIDIEIEHGSFVSLVGPSGCGKSTLLRIIAGLLRPTAGHLSLGQRTIDRPGADRGVVFQQSTSLMPWLTARGNVELGLRLRRIARADRRERALAELERVGLADFADRRVYELSGGMQQRLQIARVLANDPDTMLMDEPFGALDALTRERLQAELRRLWRETGRTVLLVTHSVEEAVALGTRVIVMTPRPGRVAFDAHFPFSASDAALAEIRRDPAFVAACASVRAAIDGPSPSGDL